MAKDEGALDRTGRGLLGLALLVLVFYGPKTSFGLIGLVPLWTALVGRSPLQCLRDMARGRRPVERFARSAR